MKSNKWKSKKESLTDKDFEVNASANITQIQTKSHTHRIILYKKYVEGRL